MTEFNLCPQCGSNKITQTDYEDTNGRRCEECDWEGEITELVSEI